eukprot:TRINITY_DN10792_c0_g1_i1.p1 TRINITY_DN10792_c0_g1~~TRINITY_DN10792_c0_g1_i1.p1  ORF type:complete len:480 (-),score=55.77 TRINITY_DN10792_c0_g1_i1:120-1559(-)
MHRSAAQTEDKETLSKRLFRWQVLVVILVYFLAVSTTVVRRSFAVVLPAIREDSAVNISSSDTGDMFAVSAASSMVGSFMSGPLVNRLGGKLTMVITGFISAGSLTGISFCRTYLLFIIVAIPMHMATGFSSPAQVKLISSWFDSVAYGRAYGIMASSSRVGATTAGLLLGMFENEVRLPWYHVLWISAGILVLASILAALFLRERPEQLGLQLSSRPIGKKAEATRPWRVIALAYLKEPRLWMLNIASFLSNGVFEVDNFVPLLLNDVFKMEPGAAGMASAVLPCGMIASLICAGFLLDRMTRRVGAILLTSMMAGTVITLGVLWAMLNYGFVNPWVATGLLFLFGLMLGAPSYMPQSLFSLRYGGVAECGLVMAINEIFQYVAQIVYDLMFGAVPQWDQRMLILLITAVVALLFYVLFFVLDVRHSILYPDVGLLPVVVPQVSSPRMSTPRGLGSVEEGLKITREDEVEGKPMRVIN